MRIDAQEKVIFELMSGDQRYEVPMYQRNYAWKADQVNAFLDDLEDALESDEEHFFGSIVLLAPSKSNLPFSLIDGQQRLTTFIILISIIRDQIADFADPMVMVNQHPVSLDTITTGLLRTGATYDLRFDSNNRIRQIFDNYVLLEPSATSRKQLTSAGTGLLPDQKKDTVDLRRAYFLIKSWLTGLLLKNAGDEDKMKSIVFKLLNTIQHNSKLLRIVVDNEDDAFVLFETLNDRGLRLTPSDLLKSFTLREIKDGDPVISAVEALDRWDDAVDTLGDYPFTKFLRHYLLSKQKEKVQVSKIFKMFKDIIESYGDNGALQNLHELAEGAKHYQLLLNDGGTPDSKLNKVIARLNLLSETHRILLIRAIRMRFDWPQILKLALAVEVLAFRWIITGGNAQEIESFYQKCAMTITSDDSSQLAAVISDIIAKSPTDDAVRGAISQNPASRVADHQFYVLQKLNYGISHVEMNWTKKQLHVEHLAPQRPQVNAGWYEHVAPKQSVDPEESVYDDYLNQWGNLTLLEFDINIPIGNAEWSVKVSGKDHEKGLKDSHVPMTKNLISISQWNKAHIVARTTWLANAMVQLTSLASYENPDTISHYCD